MSNFTDFGPAHLDVLPKKWPWSRQQYRLLKPLVWYVGKDLESATEVITVPVGFYTDLASIPRFVKVFFFWLITGWARGHKAAILHDYLYRTPGYCHRSYADQQFYDALIVEQVPDSTAGRMWAAVRSLGGKAWAKHRR